MTRGNNDHGLYGIVIGAALLLAAVILYYVVSGFLNRPAAPSSAAISSGPAVTHVDRAGASGNDSSQSVTSMPPLLIHKTGRPAVSKPISSDVPPPPVSSKSK